MDSSFIEIVFSVINTLDPSSVDFQIAWYILAHIESLGDITLGQLAQQCSVSKSTVSRFCRRIGLEDYLELQIAVRHYHVGPRRKFWYNSPDPTAENFLPVLARSIQDMDKALDWQLLHQIVDDIAAYRNVYTFGSMQSGDIAFDLQHELFICGKLVHSTQIAQVQASIISRATPEDLFLIFSSRGQFMKHIMSVDPRLLLGQNLPRIYMITSAHIAPVPPYLYRVVEVANSLEYDKANILGSVYAHLIALDYCKRYVK